MAVDMKELAADLARCGNALLALSKAVSGGKPETTVPAEAVPLEKVRAVLADKSRLGHTAEVKALLQKHGAVKLSEVDPAKYATLLAEAEALK
jgi:hypothetical protein